MSAPSKFTYLLNAMEAAAQAVEPAKEGYAEKRAAVFAHVAELERANQFLASTVDELRALEKSAEELAGEIRAQRIHIVRRNDV